MGRGGMPKKTKLGKTRLGECDSQDFRSPGDVLVLDREASPAAGARVRSLTCRERLGKG